ncbi:sulfur carrier protein ThiS [Vibrio viridaestus]|uniref:Sulfur carrier protein ThiS n=1 Tax=Vibrio viridaestus TaxID=2487322 RepID=A0A3N9TB73_9VIBR|nr:sulfur carrier protein ThiS [Vibrio viridaestus]RQW61418.1 sulfur carrier protein ThiS [Vibrio viridaestus]
MTVEVMINNRKETLASGSSLADIIEKLSLPAKGCVFAINNTVVPQSQWPSYILNSGDQISLFQAIAGG